ncbi:hypothetical protein [Glaesserella parasuis]
MNEKQLHALAAEFAKNLKNISLEKVKMHVTVTHLRPSFVMKVR